MYLLSRTLPNWRRICIPRFPMRRLEASWVVREIPRESYTAGSNFHSLSAGTASVVVPAMGSEPVEIACIVFSPMLPVTRAVPLAPGAVLDDAHPRTARSPTDTITRIHTPSRGAQTIGTGATHVQRPDPECEALGTPLFPGILECDDGDRDHRHEADGGDNDLAGSSGGTASNGNLLQFREAQKQIGVD